MAFAETPIDTFTLRSRQTRQLLLELLRLSAPPRCNASNRCRLLTLTILQ